MIHTSRTVTVGKMESVINEPIMLYRGDREVEIEFNIVGSKFMFSNGGNVIKSTNATNGQLVINTPTGENMFSEVTECNDGKVICVITKEMIDELAEVGFYSFQIRLFDESQVSRVTIPPVYQGIEIRNPIAAEDETDLVDIGLVDFSVVRKDNYENVVTFLPNGDYNKTLWEEHDVISKDRLNKVEDALYEINKGTEGLYPTFQNQYDEFSAKVNKDVKAYKEEMEDEVEQFERDMTQAFGEFKVDYRDDMYDRMDEVSEELARIENIVENRLNVRFFNVLGDGTDETEKIKQVFEFCKDKGYTVFFPKGTYLVSETISLQTSIIGKDATIYCNDIRVTKDNILIENLDIVSNLKTNGDDMYNSVELLKISNNNNTTIKNCTMSFNSDEKYGLSIIITNSKNVIIDRCKFNGAGINISNNSTFKISNCDFDLRFINEQEAIHITAHSTGTITNNNFKNSNMDFIDLFSSGFNCIISNNKFENCKGGCMIETKVHLRDEDQLGGSSDELGFCRKNIITNNQFINLIADVSSRKTFISCILLDTRDNKIDNIDNYGGDHIISNNIFEGCIDNSDGEFCVFTGINASSTRNLIVTSNIFKIYEKEGINSYSTCAIHIGNTRSDLTYEKSKNITFSDNIIFGNSCGILIGDSENVTINNNKYAFSSTDTTMRRFINLYNNPINLTISNNIYEVEGQYFIYGISVNLKTIKSVNINANKTKSTVNLECSSNEDIQLINNTLRSVVILNTNRSIISDNIFCDDEGYPIVLYNAIQNTIISKNISNTPRQSILCQNCNIHNLLVVNNLNTQGRTIRLLNPTETSKQPILVSNMVNGVIDDQI